MPINEISEKIKIPDNEFRLGITMAGAVSAGAYTGGVMDYLFEILDLWERAKHGKVPELDQYRHLIPQHKVIIDAMGGTSAGGMTTTMSAIYALNGNINPVKEAGDPKKQKSNIFYDNWVLMDDDPEDSSVTGNSFQKIWDTSDLEFQNSIQSLLNSNIIDRICERVFPRIDSNDIEAQVKNLPPYISKELQMLISHCFLRGIPLEVNFETAIAKDGKKSIVPNHSTYEHNFIAHYHLNNGKEPNSNEYLWLNPFTETYSKILKLSTIATGAFPVGFIYREFTKEHFNYDYIKTIVKRIVTGKFGMNNPDPKINLEWSNFPKDYSTLTIDGGTVNNEPYREVISIMKDKYGEVPIDEFQKYGMIMIDPFPDHAQDKNYEKPQDIFDVMSATVKTLREQSKIKRKEMIDDLSFAFIKGQIFPRKWSKEYFGKREPLDHPIACSSIGAFGGFLDIKFRQHDFFLGRNNARNFFQYWFSVPYDEEKPHPIHKEWTTEMIKTYGKKKIFKGKNGIENKIFLPIIPDLNILLDKNSNLKGYEYLYTIPEKPIYDPRHLLDIKPLIKKRLSKIYNIVLMKYLVNKKMYTNIQPTNIAENWMRRFYPNSITNIIWDQFKNLFFLITLFLLKKSFIKNITKKVISIILKDLADNNLLKNPDDVSK